MMPGSKSTNEYEHCPQCIRSSNKSSNENRMCYMGSKSESVGTTRAPCDCKVHCRSAYNSRSADDETEMTCPECTGETAGCNFWKNYDHVDKVPVRDNQSAERGDELSKINVVRPCDNAHVCKTNFYPKKTPLFTVFEGDKTSSDASENANKANETKNVQISHEKKSVELQTEESNTDASIADSLDMLIKNILYKLLESDATKLKFSKVEYDEFIQRNRDRCKCVVERMIEDLVLSDSGDSCDILTKEKEVASYNYNTKRNSAETDDGTSYSTSTTDTKTMSYEGRNKFEPKVLMSTEIKKLRKDIHSPEEKHPVENNVTYSQIVHDLLKKCFDQSTFSELSCKIENYGSQDGVCHQNDRKDVRLSFSQPSSTIKVRLSKKLSSNSSDNNTVELNLTNNENMKTLKSQEKEKKKDSCLGKEDIKKGSSEIVTAQADSTGSVNKENSVRRKRTPKTDHGNLSEVQSNGKATRTKNIHTIDVKDVKRLDSKSDAIESDGKQIPIKTSRATNRLHLQDSDVKANEENNGIISKFCMFFCRRCKN